MSLRTLALLFIVFCGARAAQAQIKITSAYYGRPKPEKTVDVKDVVQAMANAGKTSFRVSPTTFRVVPNGARPNFLVVQYIAYGQNHTGRAEDGELLTLS